MARNNRFLPKDQIDFWSKIAHKYDHVVDLQIGPRTRSLVRQRLRKEGQLGQVAEFGCGTGYYTQVLAEKAETVIATDLSPGMLEFAKQRVKAANVKFQTEDCQSTSLPSAMFDNRIHRSRASLRRPEKNLG
jgi:ubiquinone/menaquinone biosynthesis C-methylase UbiE